MNILEPHVFALKICNDVPDNKVLGANMGPTWVLPAPDGPHIGPINFTIGVILIEVWLTEMAWVA